MGDAAGSAEFGLAAQVDEIGRKTNRALGGQFRYFLLQRKPAIIGDP